MHAVGKVGQVFAGRGVTRDHSAPDNAAGIGVTERLLGELDEGLVFTNLVDTDQVFGHRKDTAASTRRCARSTQRSRAGSRRCAPATCWC